MAQHVGSPFVDVQQHAACIEYDDHMVRRLNHFIEARFRCIAFELTCNVPDKAVYEYNDSVVIQDGLCRYGTPDRGSILFNEGKTDILNIAFLQDRSDEISPVFLVKIQVHHWKIHQVRCGIKAENLCETPVAEDKVPLDGSPVNTARQVVDKLSMPPGNSVKLFLLAFCLHFDFMP